ncbi:MAG: hypothetical protein V1696_00505 [Candidatus Jorgensenbacteria bacterium]
MRHGEAIPKILEILQAGAEASAGLFDAFTSGYGASYRKFSRMAQSGPARFKTDWAESYREHQKFYTLLNKLKRDGLVVNEGKQRAAIWKITERGVAKLKQRKKRVHLISTPPVYGGGKGEKLYVISYDIPERERHKRAWLRAALLSLGFSPLQESVWVGKRLIPEDFIHDLREWDIVRYVHIFEVSKSGTLTPFK